MSISWNNIFDQVPSIKNNAEVLDRQLDGITSFTGPKDNSLMFVAGKKYWNRLNEIWNKAPFNTSYLLVDEKFWDSLSQNEKELPVITQGNIVLLTSNIEESMCHLSKLFFDEEQLRFNDLVDGRQMGTSTVHPTAWVGQNVFIGKNVKIDQGVKIYPGAVIMSECVIGENSIIYPNSTLYPKTTVGSNVIIHAGCTIGTDGYGYNFIQGRHEKIWHIGSVVLEDNVELGGNCSIDRGTFGETRIKNGTKFDNLVHIAHNVTIGNHSLLCGQVGIAGSTTIEDYCVFGGQAAVTNDVVVGAQSQIGGAAVVTGTVPAKSILSGHPARPVKEWLRGIAFVRKSSLK